MGAPAVRKLPGTRPPVPVRADRMPDDWLCTWAYRELPGNPPRTGVWELKYINAACPEHARLAAA